MAVTILSKFYGIIVHSKSNNMTLAFPGKFPEIKKKFFFFTWVAILATIKIFCSLKPNCDHKPLIIESCIEIDPLVLELDVKKQTENLFWKFTFKKIYGLTSGEAKTIKLITCHWLAECRDLHGYRNIIPQP